MIVPVEEVLVGWVMATVGVAGIAGRGLMTATVVEEVHPELGVTVKLYDPAASPLKVVPDW